MEELENRQLLVTQEKTNLERRMEELVNKYENMSTMNGKILEHLYKLYSLLYLIYDNGENNMFMFYELCNCVFELVNYRFTVLHINRF
jgi:hypothetical protein